MSSIHEGLVQGTPNSIPEIVTVPIEPSTEIGKTRLGQFAARTALSLGLALGSGAAIGTADAMLEPHPMSASAETGGYPDAGKVCVAVGDPQIGQANGTGYWCDGYQWGVPTYDSQGRITGGSQNSSRGYGYRNCTDWAAWRAKQITGVEIPHNLGDAQNWDNNAPSGTVDNTPEVGDIAVWEVPAGSNYGHVAVVESVNSNGTVNVSEYNYGQDGNYGTRTNKVADHYIDVNGPDTPAGGGGGGEVPNSGLQMILDGSGQVWAKNSIGNGQWTQETPAGETAMAAGSGGMQMILDNAGQVWARNSIGYYPNGGWTQETPPGIAKIAAGANGQQMILDSIGQVWAKNGIGYGGWTQETPPGEAAIAMGDNGLQMILDNAGQVWAKTSIGNGQWTQETPPGITQIAAGDGGLQVILDNTGQVWARNSVGYYANGGWTQETPPGIVQIAAGNNNLQMILDSVGQVWAKNSIGNGQWTQETPPGIVAIAAGDNGQQVILDNIGQVWAKNTVGYGNWTKETPSGEQKIAAGA